MRRTTTVLVGAILVAASASAGTAQSLAERVREAGDGEVRFRYATRDGIEVCENGIRRGERNHVYGTWDSDGAWNCTEGEAEITLRIRDGRVRSLDLGPASGDLLRAIPAADAAEFLLELAATARSDVAEDAILPAQIARDVVTWPRILEIARDRDRPEDVRKQAVFRLGQEAADTATDGLAELAGDHGEDEDVRESAVFALSQRPNDEGVPILMELAETAEHGDVRRSALFWLAQSGDERVLSFFERILGGR